MTQRELEYLQERLGVMEEILSEMQDHLFDVAEKAGVELPPPVFNLPEPPVTSKKGDWKDPDVTMGEVVV